MKKHFIFLLCLIMMISLFSCRENDREAQETDTTNDTPDRANDIAIQMYEAAIRDEISVFDERMGEVNLKSLRFSSDEKSLGACNLLKNLFRFGCLFIFYNYIFILYRILTKQLLSKLGL